MADRVSKIQHRREQQDTALWFVQRAQDNLASSAVADNENICRPFKLSAAALLARAEMLGRTKIVLVPGPALPRPNMAQHQDSQ